MKYTIYAIAIWAIFFIFFALLASCSTSGPKFVNVPVPIKCSIQGLPERPFLPVKSLNDSSKPNEVMRAYVESLMLLDDYADTLEEAIEVCN